MTSHHYSDSFAQPESPGGHEVLQDPARGDSSNPPALSNDDNSNSETELDYPGIVALMNSDSYDQDQKRLYLNNLSTSHLDGYYVAHMAACGFQRITVAHIPSNILTEDTYLPLDSNDDNSSAPDPRAPRPLYPAYTTHFRTAQAARTYRKRTRVAPKSNAPDIDRVKRYGRMYWVRRIYEAMIDISDITDGESSIHRQRFMGNTAFDSLDLEAAAHHVFDSALAVHERGWNRPSVYHKKVVRGKLTDVSEKSLERRLGRICLCLKHKKATVDDAVRGGVTLALLCDNPEARGFTKLSNNAGNRKRGERLKRAKGTEAEAEAGEETEQEEYE